MRTCLDLLLAIVALGILIAGQPNASEAQLVPYDDFSSGLIGPSKWVGGEQVGGAANPTTEIDRLIKSGQLEMRLTQYGLNNSDSGVSLGQVRLSVTNPTPITTMQARFNVLSGEAQTCPTNAGALVRARAQIVGGYFNDGTSPGAGNRIGDILGSVAKTVDSILGNIFVAAVTRCLDATCSNTGTLSFHQFLATWTPNQVHTLTQTWDAANHQFVFTVEPLSGGQPETITLPYTQSDATPPVVAFRELILNNWAANCNGSRLHASNVARFDNVMVNP